MNKVRHCLTGIFERVLIFTLASGATMTMAHIEWVPSAWSQISPGGPVALPVPKDKKGQPTLQNACTALMGTYIKAEKDTFSVEACVSKVIAERKAECMLGDWEKCMGQYGAACLAQKKNRPWAPSSFGPADYEACCGQSKADLRKKDFTYDTLCDLADARLKSEAAGGNRATTEKPKRLDRIEPDFGRADGAG